MNKKNARNWIIVPGLLVLAYIAKMEAINFLLAIPVGVIVAVYVSKWLQTFNQKVDESIDNLSPWIFSLMLGFIMAMFRWRIDFLVPLLAGLLAGYAVYSVLNASFITP
jgi:hypothetical protein